VADADREVYKAIERRQREALGETHDARIERERGSHRTNQMYEFVPHPVDPSVPEAFVRATTSQPAAQPDEGWSDLSATQPAAAADTVAEPPPDVVFNLSDALAYAMKNGRDFQTAKEDLYLAALALTLERFLWTPRFAADIQSEFVNWGQENSFDRAMSAVSQVAVEQRLPTGGTVTARILNSLMRDLGRHITSGESGQAIIEANIPLLRGAGRVAYESRYQAERDLIYAARNFETFRRSYLVDIAGDFFNLLSLESQIESAIASEEAFKIDLERSQSLADAERILQIEADRARVQYLDAQNRVVAARVTYRNSLDAFKIRMGMPTETRLDVEDAELALTDPQVPEDEAIRTGLAYRLDLLNDLDAIDDARRGVLVAKNNLLPDFNFSGSVSMDTDPNRHNSLSYNTERAVWRGMLDVEIPLQRKEERNQYRSALITLHRAERQHEQAQDQVRLQVRQALRRLEQARFSIRIQERNISINDFRRQQARENFQLGRLPSNRDVIEAENELRDARDRLAQGISDYRQAILEFLRDTGTLRVDDDGQWVEGPDLTISKAPIERLEQRE